MNCRKAQVPIKFGAPVKTPPNATLPPYNLLQWRTVTCPHCYQAGKMIICGIYGPYENNHIRWYSEHSYKRLEVYWHKTNEDTSVERMTCWDVLGSCLGQNSSCSQSHRHVRNIFSCSLQDSSWKCEARPAYPFCGRLIRCQITSHNLIFFWPCIMNWLYINHQILCTDYYLFIKY